MVHWIVVTGSPGTGFVYYGPFNTYNDALSYAENERYEEPWWVDTLEIP